MAVIECKLRRGRRGRFGLQNKNGYSLEYSITTDTQMSELTILQGAYQGSPDPLPSLYSQYTFGSIPDASAFCTSISLDQSEDDRNLWLARVEFGQLPPGSSSADKDIPSPLDYRIRYRLEWLEEQVAVEKDRDGNPVANTVGDDFVPGLMEPVLYPVLVCERNYATVEEILALGQQYHKTVNSLEFFGGAPGTVKMLPITSSDLLTEKGIEFYTATFRFAYNSETWVNSLLNRGWRGRPTAGDDVQRLLDKLTLLPISEPANLAQDGTVLNDGDPPVFVDYWTLTEIDYNALGLVNSND